MYRIAGADQKEYGPVTAEQLRLWITEGRANGATIARFEEGAWKPLSTFPEFAEDLRRQAGVPPASSAIPPLGSPPSPASRPVFRRNHPFAMAGVILSGLAVIPCCCFGPLFGMAGLAFSIIALIQIQQEPEKWNGKNLAIVGIVLGAASLVMFAVAMLLKGRMLFQMRPPFRL